MKLFERDLGEGRKLVPEPDQVKDDKSRLPAPLPFKKAERATPDMKVQHTLSCLLIVAETLFKVVWFQAALTDNHLMLFFVRSSWEEMSRCLALPSQTPRHRCRPR